MKNNYLLKKCALAFICFLGFKAVAQYTVSSIPSQQYVTALPVAFSVDDTYSAAIPLTFDFNFFGNTYNQVLVSTNGYIKFDTALANQASPWSFTGTIPNNVFPVDNSFLGCYHDLNNQTAQGTTTYAVIGSAPYRKFVVVFNNIPHYSCPDVHSSFQMVLYETLNILDSQIIEKEVCATWNGGRSVIGVVNADGSVAFAPPGRNTGPWAASHEGWRFSPGLATGNYSFVKCDDDTDGFVAFNLAVAQSDLWAANPGGVTFHATENDAIGQTAALSTTYTNTASTQTIYANVNGQIVQVALRVVDCNNDFDGDSVATADEDLNSDTNLANDDTDTDGIPDFADNDDDGDLILTNDECVFGRNTNTMLDTDSDGIPNYLDNDDDNDGVLTINEDYNGNHNPFDDDTNADGTPDYLQNSVALGVNQNQLSARTLNIYPNPATDVLHIDNKTGQSISEIAVYSVSGMRVKQARNTQTSIAVSDLPSGIYFVKIQIGNEVQNFKFIKK